MLSFFGAEAARRAIEDLARAGRVTVVAGAGSSMEIGLPSWEALVLALLSEIVAARGWEDDADSFRAYAAGNGLLATAEIVTALMGRGEMPAAIKRHLYGDTDPAGLLPGPLARGIAALLDEFGPTTRLATTNYDEVLELALRERPSGQRWWGSVRSSVGPDAPGTGTPGDVTVTHLHGLLGRRDRGTVVLAEGDYRRMQLDRSWQEEWMVDALSTSTCLFVGASMTDDNLIRYLYRAGRGDRSHIALFRRRPARTPAEIRFRSRAEEADTARWRHLGITPLFAGTFAEVAQFVHEVAHRRQRGRAHYRSLPERLDEWFAVEQAEGSLYRAEDAGYREVQQLLQGALEEVLEEIRALLRHEGRDAGAERLGAALWALHPPEPEGPGGPEGPEGREGPRADERAVVLASSDRLMTSVDSIAPVPLDDRSGFTGVRAMCRGVPLEEEKDTYASRWRFVLGFPVYGESPRTPLGAFTIATTTPAPATVLSGLPTGTASALGDLVVRSARTLLNIAALEPG